MFFWIGLALAFVVFVGVVSWAVRGFAGRAHEPGTTHLKPPGGGSSSGSSRDARSS